MMFPLQQALGQELLRIVRSIAGVAVRRKLGLSLVGGAVRDALMSINSCDIDFLVEGNAIEFVGQLAADWTNCVPGVLRPGTPLGFRRYGTAKLLFPAEIASGVDRLEFASARSEVYPHPAAVPLVTFPSTLEADLARRDFSINAMAFRLSDSDTADLIDLYGGREDLAARQLRILHEKSFIDDPARLIRGLRFAARFGFAFEAKTEERAVEAAAAQYMTKLPKPRLLDEFRKALEEPAAESVVALLKQRKLLLQIHPLLDLRRPLPAGRWEDKLRALFPPLADEALREVLVQLGASKQIIHRVIKTAPES
jgi:tRNA nucleotidyltransferase (CCA-adding enzyme)